MHPVLCHQHHLLYTVIIITSILPCTLPTQLAWLSSHITSHSFFKQLPRSIQNGAAKPSGWLTAFRGQGQVQGLCMMHMAVSLSTKPRPLLLSIVTIRYAGAASRSVTNISHDIFLLY